MREQSATRFVAVPPGDVFALITAPERLPEWNGTIVRVVDSPDELRPGAEWVVRLSALGQSWPSRSTVVDIDGKRDALCTGRRPTTATLPTPTGRGRLPMLPVGARWQSRARCIPPRSGGAYCWRRFEPGNCSGGSCPRRCVRSRRSATTVHDA